MKITSAEEVVKVVKSGDRVFVQGAAMTPNELVNALCDRHKELKDIEIVSIHTEGDAKYTEEPYIHSFALNSCFVGGNVRKSVNTPNAGYIPIFLSEIPWLFKRNILPLDVAIVQVSVPDKHGYCSLGVSVDVALPAIRTAKKIIAQINPSVPRTHGTGIVHVDEIEFATEVDRPIHEHESGVISDIEQKIGINVASLIEDGATLQMGIGNIPNAVLANLNNHKRLGIHTEMFSDGVLPLIESGVITGEEKAVKRGKIVSCFAVGSRKLYDFIDDNPICDFRDSGYTNDTARIRRNPKVTAINSAIEIDLTGQVCADTIGSYQFSGVGGQMDFIRGASLSPGGKPIFAMPSVTNKGISKITPFLKEGAGVTTTRAHVHYVATEFGVVNLYGKNLQQRAKELISIAHPDHRATLEKAAFERFNR
ncbi:acetyl-CoA hydrolase/transferase family protein [Flagellimonas sp. 389]|uniref:acetyl-CoA hydrolase/transferase family protein n=1 Tax=Flagellimonas sp. 389 TaxID=2835862 RepID=UPI001BD660B3|nr:acetyl-CoA hydrolase/transferase C-terminal domain-containing protein [uncultured Allomuricauda sp.]MBS9460895.1 acetyl-CoA hydrolase/transferase family protein [Flagellimonas sp. 389]